MTDSRAIIVFLAILAIVILIGSVAAPVIVAFYEQVRGPAIDITVNTVVNTDGNLSKYSLIAVMPDIYSYNKLLAHVNSKDYETIKEYFLRDISDKTLFEYQYDEDKQKITFKSTKTFDPNQEMKTVTLDKSNWKFIDSSYVSGKEYFIPDAYINSITYTYTTPATILSTSGETSESIFYGKRSKWIINRYKETFDSTSNDIKIPAFSVETSPPQAASGLLIVFLSIAIIGYFRKIR